MNALAAFPRRPLQVRLGFKQAVSLAGAATVVFGLLGAVAYVSIGYGPALLRESRIWSTGTAVPLTSWEGGCLNRISWLPLSSCRFSLTFQGPDGSIRRQDISALLFGGLTPQGEPQLKVDPKNPDHVALSWLAGALTERWLVLASLCLACLGLGALLWGAVVRSLSEWRLYRAMGREPRPIAVTLIEMRHVANPGYAREYSFRYEVEGVERHGRQRLRVLKGTHGVAPEDWEYEAPIMLSGAKALALLGPGGRALLVPQSFYPLVVTDSEIGSVLSQASHSG